MSIFNRLFGGSAKREADRSSDPAARADAVVAQLQAMAQPCLRIVAGGTGKSRLGGIPDLARPWPRYEGRPLCCVAQLDLAELRAADGPDWLPDSGRLMFFYDLEHGAWGLEAGDAGSSVVIHEAGDPAPAAEPADLPEDARFPAYPVGFANTMSLPSEERLEIDWKGMTKAERRAVEAAIEALQPPEPVHQVGGFPHPVQSDDMELQCQSVTQGAVIGGGRLKSLEPMSSAPADWRLLLQLDTDNDAGMMWGDTGTLYFWIREQDARAGDFSKIWMILQCC
jgi:uncharacterized protein YwqG